MNAKGDVLTQAPRWWLAKTVRRLADAPGRD
jgi:hypothetical protein